MTDMAPIKSAEARRRRERLAGMYLSALGAQAAKFNAKPDDLAKAREAVYETVVDKIVNFVGSNGRAPEFKLD